MAPLQSTQNMAVLLFVLLCATTVLAYPGKESCDTFTEVAVEVRNGFKTNIMYDTIVAMLIRDLGLNIEDEEKINKFLCRLLDADISNINDLASRFGRGRSTANVAFGYGLLTKAPQIKLEFGVKRLKELESRHAFYERTGFPNFPLKLGEKELRLIVQDTELDALAEMFYPLSEWSSSGVSFKSEILVNALADSQTMEEFAKGIENEYYYPPNVTQDKIYFVEIKNGLKSTQRFLGYFERTGLLNLPRGGIAMKSCDSLVKDADSILQRVLDTVPEIRLAEVYMGLPFSLSNVDARKEFLCRLFSATKQADIASLVPANYLEYFNYDQSAMGIMAYMTTPSFYMHYVFNFLNAAYLAKGFGSPTFTTPIPKDLAEEFVYASTYDRRYLGLEGAIEDLQNSTSLEQFRRSDENYNFNGFFQVYERISDKLDLIPDFMLDVFCLVTRMESYGLFMLPK